MLAFGPYFAFLAPQHVLNTVSYEYLCSLFMRTGYRSLGIFGIVSALPTCVGLYVPPSTVHGIHLLSAGPTCTPCAGRSLHKQPQYQLHKVSHCSTPLHKPHRGASAYFSFFRNVEMSGFLRHQPTGLFITSPL